MHPRLPRSRTRPRREAPPLTVASLSLKTIINPATAANEVVAASVVYLTKVPARYRACLLACLLASLFVAWLAGWLAGWLACLCYGLFWSSALLMLAQAPSSRPCTCIYMPRLACLVSRAGD